MLEENAAGHKPSRRFLESIDESCLTQTTEEPERRGALQDLILISKEGLVENAEEPEGRSKDKLTPLGFRRAHLGFFKCLWGTVQQGKALR